MCSGRRVVATTGTPSAPRCRAVAAPISESAPTSRSDPVISRPSAPRLRSGVAHLDDAAAAGLAGLYCRDGIVDFGERETVGDQLAQAQLAQLIELDVARDVSIRGGIAAMRADQPAAHMQRKRVDRQAIVGERNA